MSTPPKPHDDRVPQTSFANIYRVLRVLGSASVATTALSLLRNKAFAIFLGPMGYGSIVLLTSLVNAIANLGGLGIGYSATRLISRARGRSRERTASMTEAILVQSGHRQEVATFALGSIVLLVYWRMSGSDGWSAAAIVTAAFAASFTVMAAVNTTRLQIKRLAGRLAVASVLAAILHTMVAITAASLIGLAAVPIAILSVPLTLVAATRWALRDHPLYPAHAIPRRRRDILRGALIRTGAGLMLPGLVDSGGAFAVRGVAAACMGLAGVGQVYAASALVTFVTATVMTAMNQDFLPRLCEAVDRPVLLRRLASEQLLVSLQLSAPVLLAFCAFSETLTRLFFSSEFADAARVLPIMSILVVANICVWPIHTLQTALGRSRDQLMGSVANILAVLLVIALLRDQLSHGWFAAALVCGGACQLAAQGLLLWRNTGIAYRMRDLIAPCLILAAVAFIAIVQLYAPPIAKAGGVLAALGWAVSAILHYLRHRA